MAACGVMIFLLVMRVSVCDASYGDSKCCVLWCEWMVSKCVLWKCLLCVCVDVIVDRVWDVSLARIIIGARDANWRRGSSREGRNHLELLACGMTLAATVAARFPR